MRILEVYFKDRFLKNLTLNFSLKEEKLNIAKFIVLAGENGVGKTTILNNISNFKNIDKIVFVLDDLDIQDIIDINEENKERGDFHYQDIDIDDFRKNPKLIVEKEDNQIPDAFIVKIPGIKDFSYSHGRLYQNGNPIQIFLNRLLFKYWHNNIEPTMDKVDNISNYDVDNSLNSSNKNIIDLNREINIPQLLVDLDNKDAVEFRNEFNSTGNVNEKIANQRMNRFKEAFNDFFDNGLVFKEIGPNHEIFFEKGKNVFGINSLSSGEKMIIQCGASLLKDAGVKNCNTLVCLDEPEQALHPKWQERILDYCDKTVSLEDDYKSQIIVSTHSEHVLKSALKRQDSLIIILKFNPETNEIEVRYMTQDEYVLSYQSYDEIKYRAFDILSPDYHDDLMSEIQESSRLGCKNQDMAFLKIANCPKKHWTGKNRNKELNKQLDTESLPLYIRNCMHHPELKDSESNSGFSHEELKESVRFLEDHIKNERRNE